MDIETEVPSNPGPSGSSLVASEQAHLMRVTDHHKMRNLVKFALEFLVVSLC